MRIILEAMDRDEGNGRSAAIYYSADVISQLKWVRREVINAPQGRHHLGPGRDSRRDGDCGGGWGETNA